MEGFLTSNQLIAVSLFVALTFSAIILPTFIKPSNSDEIKKKKIKKEKIKETFISTSQTESNLSELRGYKTTSDGRKTTYFNRELTENEKALLGDSTPKKIESDKSTPNFTNNGNSVWNSAGTWEEKVCTEWATKELKNKLQKVSMKGKYIVSVKKVDSLDGDATITNFRGKKKYICDFSACLTVEFSVDGRVLEGQVRIEDITFDQDYTMEVSVTLPPTLPAPSKQVWNMLLADQEREGSLRNKLKDTIDEFFTLFRCTH